MAYWDDIIYKYNEDHEIYMEKFCEFVNTIVLQYKLYEYDPRVIHNSDDPYEHIFNFSESIYKILIKWYNDGPTNIEVLKKSFADDNEVYSRFYIYWNSICFSGLIQHRNSYSQSF